MADVIFVLHKRITVSAAPRPAPAPPSPPRSPNPYRDYAVKDSRSDFVARPADEVETDESAQKLKAAVDARVEELRHEHAVQRRVEELRRAE